MSIAESFQLFNYELIVSPVCGFPDIGPKHHKSYAEVIQKGGLNCTSSGFLLNPGDDGQNNLSAIYFQLEMDKNVCGHLDITTSQNMEDDCIPEQVHVCFCYTRSIKIAIFSTFV